MASPKTIVCPSCGFRNSPPPANHRCGSCGARMEALGRVIRSREEELERRYQQEGFSPSLLVHSHTCENDYVQEQVSGLPMVETFCDSAGSTGMLATIQVRSLGRFSVVLISPRLTFTEPVVASFCAANPTDF